MTTELQGRLMALMNELSEAKLPAIFIVAEADQIISVKNSNDSKTSELFVEYMNGSEERQSSFLEKLEQRLGMTADELIEQQSADETTEKDN